MNAPELIAQLKGLAPVSNSALNLMNMLDQPGIANEDIVQVLKFDNVLTAKLLRACNSPFYGLEEPVASVEQAVFILGHQQILHIVLSIAFSSSMVAPLPGYAAEAKELWQHSLVTALAAENISRQDITLPAEPPVAFTAGLLHDIGKVVLNHVLTPEFQSAIRLRIANDATPRTVAEKEIIGVDHAEVGRCLLQSWRVPEEILEAVEHHHAPVCKPKPKLSSIIHAANCIAHLIGNNLGWEAFAIQADGDALGALGIDEAKMDDLMIAAHDSMSQVENLMTIA